MQVLGSFISRSSFQPFPVWKQVGTGLKNFGHFSSRNITRQTPIDPRFLGIMPSSMYSQSSMQRQYSHPNRYLSGKLNSETSQRLFHVGMHLNSKRGSRVGCILGGGLLLHTMVESQIVHAEEKNDEEFERILTGNEIGFNLNEVAEKRDSRGLTLLQAAVVKGDLACMRKLLQIFNGHPALKEIDDRGRNLLHIAAIEGQTHFIPLLLSCEIFEINRPDRDGYTPLHWAIHGGHDVTVEKLIDGGASLVLGRRSREGREYTPLGMSIVAGNPRTLSVLLRKDSLNQIHLDQHIVGFGTVIHLAIRANESRMLDHLLKERAEETKCLIEKLDEEGRTPLQLAAYLGDIHAIKVLKSQEADLEKGEGEIGGTAVHYATVGGQFDAIRALDYLGANLKATDKNGDTPSALSKKEIGDSGKCKALLDRLPRIARIRKTMPPDFLKQPPENLAFGGGGSLGIAHAGAIKAMEDGGLLEEVRRLAGTSAGAIAAAGIACGYSGDEIIDKLGRDFRDFLDPPEGIKQKLFGMWDDSNFQRIKKIIGEYWQGWGTLRSPIQHAKQLKDRLNDVEGLCEGVELQRWLEAVVHKGTNIQDCTFAELHTLSQQNPKKYKDLYVYAVKIEGNQPELVCFSHEDEIWRDVVISSALRASASIPGAFKPAVLRFKEADGQVFSRPRRGNFLDGGMVKNVPIDAFDDNRYQSEKFNHGMQTNRRTLAFKLEEDMAISKEGIDQIKTAKDLALAVYATFWHAEQLVSEESGHNESRTIILPTFGVSGLNFQLDSNEKQKLMRGGKQAVETFFYADE